MADLLSDNFESGNLSAWTSETDTGQNLSVDKSAALHGIYGLKCIANGATDAYVTDETLTSEVEYRVRCYINPNSLTMANNNEFMFIHMFSGGSTAATVCLKYTTTDHYIIYASIRDDASNYTFIDANDVGDSVHCVEVHWKKATGVGSNNGFLQLWVDDVSIGSTSTIDNDTRAITATRLGRVSGQVGTSGTFYLDDFASNDDGNKIGLLANTMVFNDEGLIY